MWTEQKLLQVNLRVEFHVVLEVGKIKLIIHFINGTIFVTNRGYWVLSRRTFREITREKRRFMREMRDRRFQIGGRMPAMTLVIRATFRG